ncbi:MAG: RHS repeat protein [Microthrixaceae bacterium]|nr:RHS repeat protein [Microthrixaceae bacterium]
MWVWDQRSRLKSHTDVNGRSTGYGWDDTANLTSISYPGPVHTGDQRPSMMRDGWSRSWIGLAG